MKSLKVAPAKEFNLVIDNIAPDKSISHRSAIFSLLSDKPSTIYNYLQAEDTLNTLKIVQELGANVKKEGEKIVITPPKKLQEPTNCLDCGNSGTGMRIFCGFLAGVEGFFILTGDKYLKRRPMDRVTEPLREIGAKIDGREEGNKAPLAIRGDNVLKPFKYESSIASAQVKTAMILAGLRAKGESRYSEPELSRDHTERMLKGMGAEISTFFEKERYVVEVKPLNKPLEPLNITIPADPSSAFFFAVAGAVIPNSQVTLKNVTLNPTRIEAFKVLEKMGAKVEYRLKENRYEPIGDIVVKSAPLKGIEVKEKISWLIDELPALSIAMACANGVSRVRNAKELRVKESDRISSIVENLRKCGIEVKEFADGYEIKGGEIKKAKVNSFGDHRIAMSFLIAGLINGMEVEDVECIETSFPNFQEILAQISEVKSGD